jgi:hypothetical protein
MKKITFIITAVAICFGIAANTFAQRISKTDTPVTSAITNSVMVNQTPVQFSIQSDNNGSLYKTDSATSVKSIIQGIGDWELDMLASTTRGVSFAFDSPVVGSNPGNKLPPQSYVPHRTRFITQCSTSLTSLTAVGASSTCPLIIAIDEVITTPTSTTTTRYSLRFNSAQYPANATTGVPAADNVKWICTAALSGKCTGWRAQSDPTGNGGKLVAQLLKITRVGNSTTTEDYGKYYISYDISLSKP